MDSVKETLSGILSETDIGMSVCRAETISRDRAQLL